jgi:hypothetical protein
MNRSPNFLSGSAAFLALGMTASAIAPIVMTAPAFAATFSDIRTHWARPFIEPLAAENILTAYSGSKFNPNDPVTRAQANTMLRQAFATNKVQLSNPFDIAAAENFLNYTYADGSSSRTRLRSTDKVTRTQVLVAITRGLGLQPSNAPEEILKNFTDAAQVPDYAVDNIAAATENGLVVNYPSVAYFSPTKIATRADVAAFIYQALVQEGAFSPLSSRIQASQYVVQATVDNNQASTPYNNPTGGYNQPVQNEQYKIAQGTLINVKYLQSNKVVVAPGETLNMTLLVADDIKNAKGQILIPKNSEIQGQIVPRYSGSQFLGDQFVAQKIIIGNRTYNNVNLTSQLVTSQQPTSVNQQTLQGSAISAAAQVLLGRVTGGRINPGNILGSVLSGGLPNNNQQQDNNKLTIIDPANDLRLTLGNDFYVNGFANTTRY